MLSFNRITGHIGAEVKDIRLTDDLGEDTFDALRQGLLDYKVLVFRDQTDMTMARHIELARAFGPIDVHPFHERVDGYAEIDLLRSQGVRATEGWHTDLGFQDAKNLVTILRAVDIPEYGRDTAFIDSEAAYEGLSEPMKRALEGLVAVRDWRHVFRPASANAGVGYANISDEDYAYRDENMPVVEFPVVATNLETGRKSIAVDRVFTTRIKDMRPDESQHMLRFLFDQFNFTEYQMRASWQPGTVVMWDNRTCLHAMVFDSDFPRIMHRTLSKGARLFAERQSRPLAA